MTRSAWIIYVGICGLLLSVLAFKRLITSSTEQSIWTYRDGHPNDDMSQRLGENQETTTISSGEREKLHVKTVCDNIKNEYHNISSQRTMSASSQSGSNTLSHIKGVVDHYHRIVYCDLPKSGTTSWHSVFAKLAKHESIERRQLFERHPYQWHYYRANDRYKSLHTLGFNRLSRGADVNDEVNSGFPNPRTDYYKFIIVRHPLERLASGYTSIIRHRTLVNFKNKPTMRKRYERLLHEYAPAELARNSNIPFHIYLRYVSLPDEELDDRLDIHWKTVQTICEPCSMNYDYIGHLEQLDAALNHLLPKLNVTRKKFPTHNKSDNTLYKYLYQNISESVMQGVIDKYKIDAYMFGYTFEDYLQF